MFMAAAAFAFGIVFAGTFVIMVVFAGTLAFGIVIVAVAAVAEEASSTPIAYKSVTVLAFC